MKILIVDDTPTNLKLLRLTLDSEGHDVVEAKDGTEALAVLKRETVDAIVSDVMMPTMDGYQLCHRVRQDENWHQIPFILYSNTFASKSSAKLGLEFGADAFIKKPAPTGVIVNRLKTIIADGPRRRPTHPEGIPMLDETVPYNRHLVELLEAHATESERSKKVLLETTHTSLTRLKEMENQQEALNRQAALINQSFDAVVVWDWNGAITFWNPAAEQLYGYTATEATGCKAHELFRSRHQSGIKEIQQCLERDKKFEAELQHTTKAGQSILVETRMRLVSAKEHTYVIETNRDITATRQAELQLSSSMKETLDLKLALDAHAIVATTNVAGKLTSVNDKFCEVSGYTREELLGQDLRLLNSGYHPKAFFKELWQTILAGKVWHGEIKNRTKNGTFYWEDTTIMPILDQRNRPHQFMAIRAIITARKLAEEAVQLSENRYRSLVSAMAQIVWNASAEGEVAGPLPSWQTYTGQTEEEVQKFGWTNAIHPDDVDHTLRVWTNAVKTKSLYQVDYRIRRHDGIYRLFRVRGAPVPTEDGGVQEWVGTCTDITDERQAERERDRFFSLSLDPMCIASPDGFFRRLNPAFETILGFSPEEMMARPFVEFVHPDDVAATAAVMAPLGDGKPLVDFENRYRCKDGSYRYFLWTCVPADGLFYAAARDITERRKALAEILDLNNNLEQRVTERTAQLDLANKELESCSYSVSHDLRAPLRHIQGYVEMLTAATAGQLAEKPLRYLQVITEASIEMGELIDDLLEFSRTSRVELQTIPCPQDDLVQNTIRHLELETKDRNITWKIETLPAVTGDAATLRQVWVNLIGNAVKYSRQRDPAVIEIGCRSEPGEPVIFFVRDNGAGFDMAYVHKLFGVFQRLHRADEFEGTGIGLATVKRIIARHGGRVWAESKLGAGATFSFTLPPTKPTAPSPTRQP